jgi:hypothetical protein
MSQLGKTKDPTKNAYKDKGLMGRLGEHLKKMGLDATLLPPESPEAVGPIWKKGPLTSGRSLGCIKIRNRSLDLVQIEGQEDADVGRFTYLYHFIVRANVEGLEHAFKAEIKPITKGFLGRKTIDFRWEGGELARRLNLDSQLKSMMLKDGLDQLPVIEVRADKANKCVRITKTPVIKWGTGPLKRGGPTVLLAVGRKFPTREEFEAYDRIAHHIRSMRKTSDLVTQ